MTRTDPGELTAARVRRRDDAAARRAIGSRARADRHRGWLFRALARIVHTARRLHLRLPRSWPWEADYQRLRDAIA